MNDTKETKPDAPDGRLDALIGRLHEHAEVHETCLPHDTDQRQWTEDLRAAASWLEQMSVALKIVHTWARVPGALDPKHTEDMCAGALRRARGELRRTA